MTVLCAMIAIQIGQADKPVDLISPEEFCRQAFAKRVAEIQSIEREIADLPKKNDFSKLSAQAREKIEKPYRERLAKAIADKSTRVYGEYPARVQSGQVFKFPAFERKPPGHPWRLQSKIDDTTLIILTWDPTDDRDDGSFDRVVDRPVVLSGIQKSEYKDKQGYPLKPTGAFQRVEDIKINGKTYPQIKRWPFEKEARDMWPAYFEKHEANRLAKEAEEAGQGAIPCG